MNFNQRCAAFLCGAIYAPHKVTTITASKSAARHFAFASRMTSRLVSLFARHHTAHFQESKRCGSWCSASLELGLASFPESALSLLPILAPLLRPSEIQVFPFVASRLGLN
jgi:hypothetical protein